MNAKARTARRIIAQRRTEGHLIRKAQRAALSPVASAKTRLIAAGIDPSVADRFSGAFSRGVIADGTSVVNIKLKGRVRKNVAVKLYTVDTFASRLSTYRPKDKIAAVLFAQAAHRLAA